MEKSYEGVKDFYKDRLMAALNYGPISGMGIVQMVRECIAYDQAQDMLTLDEYFELFGLSHDIVSALWDIEGNKDD